MRYTIYNDPHRVLDRDFFGEWDAVKEEWTFEGIFDYDKYSNELAGVISAVKDDNNNYGLAKEELLKYYRNKFKDTKIPRYTRRGDDRKRHALCADCLEKNVYCVNTMNGHAMGFFNMCEEEKWYSMDVTFSMERHIFGTHRDIEFILMSVDKELNPAYINSRKSDHIPYLELVVNGEKVKVECHKNTMLVAGDKAKEIFSNQEVFEVQESGIYHNHDEEMKRVYLVFDLGFLKKGDEVSSVTLNVYGNTKEGEKEIFVYNEYEASWNENTHCWANVTDELLFSCSDTNTWDFITSYIPFNKGKICFFHRAYEFSPVAQIYADTKDEKYAYTFIRNAMGMVHFVGSDREVNNELDMGRYCDNHLSDLMKVIGSKHMTPDRFTGLVKNFYKVAKYLVEVYYGKATNNWGSYATEGVYSVMGYFSELKVRDEWFEKTVRENDRLMKGFMNSDYSCIELSQNYHHTLLSTIIDVFNIYNVTKEPLPFSENLYELIYRLIKTFYYTMSPTRGDYNVADSTYAYEDLTNVFKKWYDVCNIVLKDDEEIKYIVTDGKEGKLPDFTTFNQPINRRTYMKTDWSRDALAMLVTGKREASHGHNDVFSLAMMAYGRHLVTDQGYGAQLTGDIFEYMTKSSTHNIVMADGVENTERKDADQLGFDTNDKFDYCEYSGSNNRVVEVQNRSVTFCKEHKFWIVTDYVKPVDCEKETTFTQIWNMIPSANMTIDEGTNIVRSNFKEGANVLIVPVGEIDSAGFEPTKYSPGGGTIIESKKAVLTKKCKGECTYNTLIIPLKEGENASVEVEAIKTDSDVNAFRGVVNGKGFYFTHANNCKKEVDLGEIKTTAVNTVIFDDGTKYEF